MANKKITAAAAKAARKAAIRRAVAKYRNNKMRKTASVDDKAAARRAAIRKAVAALKNKKKVTANIELPNQKKIDALAQRIASRIEARMERILADTEEVIKDNVPTRYVGQALRKMTASLNKEGIGAQWDYKLTRAQRAKTAGMECGSGDVDEACSEITKAVTDETEELLAKADDTVQKMAAKHFKMRRVATRRLRNKINEILASKGLNVNLEGEDVEE